MSEPLSTNDIEDVVSSVRRLVSTEQRPRATTREIQDKLLLTPALRVVAETAPPSDPLILTTLAVDDEPAALVGPPASERLQVVEAEWEDELWTETAPPLAERALEAEVAELLVVDESEVLVASAPTPWPEAESDWQDEGAPMIEVPDIPEVPEGTGSAEAQADLAEEEVDVAEMLTAAVVEDEGFRQLDHAELHDLVRAMVRQELQGGLGERITRNVRKLVRAEINRALAARALD